MTVTKKTILLALSAIFIFSMSTAALAGVVKKSSDFYEVTVNTSGKASKKVATVKVVGVKGYHPNKLYPWKLEINASENIKIEKTIYKKKDAKKFNKDVVIFEVPYEMVKKGKVSAVIKLSLCDDKQCKADKVALTW